MSNERLIAVDLFAGAGGMSLGFEQAGFDILAAVEIDPIHCATHEYNFPRTKIFCKSVEKVTASEIRIKSSIGTQDIDVVCGGSPCQGFSIIGKRLLDDPRNNLIKHFIRLVVELKAKYFVFENVKGLIIGDHINILLEAIAEFKKNGYECSYKVLNAARYGVPQNRERLFLLGHKKELAPFVHPLPKTKILKKNLNKYNHVSNDLSLFGDKFLDLTLDLKFTPTVGEALESYPTIEDYIELYNQDWVEKATYVKPVKNNEYNNFLRGLTLEDYSYQRDFDPRFLSSSWRTVHSIESRKRFDATQPGEIEPISRFHKLNPEGLCTTLRAGTDASKGAHTSARPIHPYLPRCITVREGARLHSYPDWFRFHATKWHGFRQVGNSVPPLLAKAVALEIIKVVGLNPIKPRILYKQVSDGLLNFTMLEAVRYYAKNKM